MEDPPSPHRADLKLSRKRTREDEGVDQGAEGTAQGAADRDRIKAGDTVIYLMHDSNRMGSMLKVNPKEQQKLGSRKYNVRYFDAIE